MHEPVLFRNTAARLAEILNRHQIRFHVTGGFTSVLWGEPRLTLVLDLVLDPAGVAADGESLPRSLEDAGFLVSREALELALLQRGMFQVLDLTESLKVDLYTRELIPDELGRSIGVELFEGLHLPVVSRTDAALSRLARVAQGSHKSRQDFLLIYRGATEPEQQVIWSMARQSGMMELLGELLAEEEGT